MERRTSGHGRAALLVSALAVLCAGSSSPAAAQEDARPAVDRPLRVTVTTEGIYGSFRPRAVVSVSRDAHVAVFEVEPGVGALKFYPYASGRSERRAAGSHRFDLSGIRASNLRDVFHAHLGHRLRFRGGHHPDAYLLAVASERPLELSELSSGRVFAFRPEGARGIDASVGEVATALLEAVVSEPGSGGWDYDLHAFSKFRSGDFARGFGCGRSGFGLGFHDFHGLRFRGFGTFGHARALHRTHGPFLHSGPVSLSPISFGACYGFGFVGSRLTSLHGFGPFFGFPALDWPFGPRRPARPAEDDEREILDTGGITVGEPRPADPWEVGAEGWTRSGVADSARQALLERVADARRDGQVTAEEVSALVEDARLGLPRSLPDRMRIEAFRRHRAEGERSDRFGRFGDRSWPANRGFSVPRGVRGGGDRAGSGARRPGPPGRVERPRAGRPNRPSVDRPSPPRRGGAQRPQKVKKVKEEGGS